MKLADKLASLTGQLTVEERESYKVLLAMAAGGLAPDGTEPGDAVGRSAFAVAVNALARLQPHRERVPRGGVVYRGRPPFITGDVLGGLQREAAEHRSDAERFNDHFVFSSAPMAHSVGVSADLQHLVASHASAVAPTARANYLYYDEPGLGIEPHVDTGVFALNAIVMLEHEFRREPSALVLYPIDSTPQRILLEPGEMLLIYADSLTHARERMKEDERVTIVAFGFRPLGDEESGDG